MNEARPDHIMQIGLGFWASKTLLSAIELGVFTELAKQPRSLAELSARLGLHARGAHDFLDALVSLQFLERRNGTYFNTPSTDLFLDSRKPSYIGGILEMANQRLYPFWGSLTTALTTGQPQNESARGSEDLFTALYADPERLRGFLKAMSGISHGANIAIGRQFDWKPYNSLFEDYIVENSLSGRVRFHPGSFFDSDIPKADVVTMGHILHDWNLETKKMLIRKAYEALPSGGAFIVYEAIIDDDRSRNSFGLLMSLNMLIETPDGFDYTGADCIGWMQETGFHSCRVEHLSGPDSMVIGIK
jgi:hypothetical protein